MSSNSDQIVQHIQQEFQSLLAYVTDSTPRTAYATELTLFRPLLAHPSRLVAALFSDPRCRAAY